MFVVL
jgi:coiled-coil domain-containing protein 130